MNLRPSNRAKKIIMKQYEYRIEYLQLKTGRSNEDQILEALGVFGKEGWRLNMFYREKSLRTLASWKGGFNLLLEKEIENG
jgi:hypothetical protein